MTGSEIMKSIASNMTMLVVAFGFVVFLYHFFGDRN